ncbi:hypothetical protein [Candidatus Nitronereus thalassa]|uniref:Cytoplasmic protein n=1 Tax=Candidatus Nitronereus thalassa TaxID=3020898 RepID=A0ABU3K502_9BACT|nr:hypothetical protein [Candidatus Nitronereus thalassa]MDT7041490.1 hypothetical protein [Candidatus Nitronereus thalassa]
MARFPFDPRAFSGKPGRMRPQQAPQGDPNEQFRSLNASLLYCPTCKEATPARERLLLVLPSGNKFEYVCSYCGSSTGEKTDQDQQDTQIFIP